MLGKRKGAGGFFSVDADWEVQIKNVSRRKMYCCVKRFVKFACELW